MISAKPLFRRVSPSRLGGSVMRLAVAVLILYPSYRYPLQVNFSGTSPNYADTPTVLKVGKYVIAMAVAAFLLAIRRPKLIAGDFLIGITMLFGTSAMCVEKFALTGDTAYLQPLFWPWFAMLVVSLAPRISLASVQRLVRWMFYVSSVVEAVQILLFVAIGRLPALAYDNSIAVRFGSFLDDPNGFAAICFLYLGWSLHARRGAERVAFEVLATAMILISQSLTAVGFLALFWAVQLPQRLVRSPIKTSAALAALLCVAYLNWQAMSDVVGIILNNKSGSIAGHLGPSVSETFAASPQAALWGAVRLEPSESFWVGAIINYGIPYTLVYVAMVGMAALHLFKLSHLTTSRADRQAVSAMLVFSLYFSLGGLNLPFFAIFPCSMLFFLIYFLVLGSRFALAPPSIGGGDV